MRLKIKKKKKIVIIYIMIMIYIFIMNFFSLLLGNKKKNILYIFYIYFPF